MEELRRITDEVDLQYKKMKLGACLCCIIIVVVVVIMVVTGTGFTGGDASLSYTYNYLNSLDYFYDGTASHWNAQTLRWDGKGTETSYDWTYKNSYSYSDDGKVYMMDYCYDQWNTSRAYYTGSHLLQIPIFSILI